FKPTFGLVPTQGVFPLAPSFDVAGPMAATVAGCAEAMGALVPGFRADALPALSDVRVGVAWLDEAAPLVRARVTAAAARFPHRRPVRFPFLPQSAYALFMREAADVHRDLFATHGELYGENVRRKLERCLRVSDEEVETARHAREAHRVEAEEALGDLDLLVAPTLAFVAPPADVVEAEIREAVIRLTYPFSALGWPALAVPCGLAEHGLPASVSLVGRKGEDELVLAAGLALSATL
ncbi:MAG: hypothetical protein ICV74_10765, partial [Thermoleophilia bacterium]|nr:hypothetical protein [Thermoleophilia bacterium]